MKFINNNYTGTVTIEHKKTVNVRITDEKYNKEYNYDDETIEIEEDVDNANKNKSNYKKEEKTFNLAFTMALFRKGRRRTELYDDPSPFDILNRYLSRCDNEKIENIFNFYYNCRKILDEEKSYQTISNLLTIEITKLSKVVLVDDMIDWVKKYSSIVIPSDLKKDFDDIVDKSLVTRERTYIREDYIELLAWVLCLRFIAPVWSTYAEKTGNDYGTIWKLYYAYDLLSESDYVKCRPAERFSNYVKITIPPTIDYNSIIIRGISKTDYPRWVLAATAIRRLSLANIDDINATSLIKIAYKYITQQTEKEFAGLVKVIGSEDGVSPSDNDTISALEGYSSRQTLSDGDVRLAIHYLSYQNIPNIVNQLESDLPVELVYQAYSAFFRDSVNSLVSSPIEEPQLILTQWIINKVVAARMLRYVDRESLLVAMAITSAWYWHNGFYSLSLLNTAVKVDNAESHQVTGTEKRSRIVRSKREALFEYYPYYQKTTGKQDEPKGAAQISIEYLEKSLTNYDWFVNVPDEWINNDKINLESRQYSIPYEIKENLFNLALVIAKNSQLTS